MSVDDLAKWTPCENPECNAASFSPYRHCLAHLDGLLGEALKRAVDGQTLDARGVTFTHDLLERIAGLLPKNKHSRAIFPFAWFYKARFQRDIYLDGITIAPRSIFDNAVFEDNILLDAAEIGGGTRFVGATFGREVSFDKVNVQDVVDFGSAMFGDRTTFKGAVFGERVRFAGAYFGSAVDLANASFSQGADFSSATFGDNASLRNMEFARSATFKGARFGKNAVFDDAKFGDDAHFEDVTIGDGATFTNVLFGGSRSLEYGPTFDGAKFGDLVTFGPLFIFGCMSLRQATFGSSPRLLISADRLDASESRFPGGGRLDLRWAEILLDGAEFGRPAVIQEAPRFPVEQVANEAATLEDPEVWDPDLIIWADKAFESESDEVTSSNFEKLLKDHGRTYRRPQPRLICLAGCDVQHLTVVGIDLRACRFIGAHNLSKLRLEGPILLPNTPRRAMTPWRWSRRRTIAEEHYWRETQPGGQEWRGAAANEPSPYKADWHDEGLLRSDAGQWSGSLKPFGPATIANTYRALRKGLEDDKDEPGAADFYYGELEMRRKAAFTPRVERFILSLYWLLSGYALRASRSIAALAILIAIAGAAFHINGFIDPQQPFATRTDAEIAADKRQLAELNPIDRTIVALKSTDAWTYSAGTATAIITTATEARLTRPGRIYRVVERIIGPLLLGLSVLSIRGRVRR